MTGTFTDLLDEYLKAKKELETAIEGYVGYDRDYFFSREYGRRDDAAQKLNDFMGQAKSGQEIAG